MIGILNSFSIKQCGNCGWGGCSNQWPPEIPIQMSLDNNSKATEHVQTNIEYVFPIDYIGVVSVIYSIM